MKQRWSPNFGPRRNGLLPQFIIIHATEMASAELALARLCDEAAQVSAHYVLDYDGSCWQLVEESQRAWHCGVSAWQGLDDMNSRSIGIELQNQIGEAFPNSQIQALIKLIGGIIDRWPDLRPNALLGHGEIAPSRRQDPGRLFPWADLAQAGFGHWPTADDMMEIITLAKTEADNSTPQQHVYNLCQKLRKIGYCGEKDEDLIAAFQTRYNPRDTRIDGDFTTHALSHWLLCRM